MPLEERLDHIVDLASKIVEDNARMHAFIDASPWGILVVDRDFKIVFMNATLERMCGWKLHELYHRSMDRLIPKEIRKVHRKHEKDYASRPRVRYGDHPFEPELLCKGGSRLPVEISLSPADVEGEEYFFASLRPRETLTRNNEYL